MDTLIYTREVIASVCCCNQCKHAARGLRRLKHVMVYPGLPIANNNRRRLFFSGLAEKAEQGAPLSRQMQVSHNCLSELVFSPTDLTLLL